LGRSRCLCQADSDFVAKGKQGAVFLPSPQALSRLGERENSRRRSNMRGWIRRLTVRRQRLEWRCGSTFWFERSRGVNAAPPLLLRTRLQSNPRCRLIVSGLVRFSTRVEHFPGECIIDDDFALQDFMVASNRAHLNAKCHPAPPFACRCGLALCEFSAARTISRHQPERGRLDRYFF